MQARLIFDPPASGAWNMARDESLLDQAAGDGHSTLRFYSWAAPTLTLGYFQQAADRAQHAASACCPLVRRSTGGGAILHDQELTYSFTTSVADRLSNVRTLYSIFHQTLVDTLAEWQVAAEVLVGEAPARSPVPRFLCFQRFGAGDVMLSGAKVAGSAQRRHRGAVLQHGSVLLRRSPCAPELPGIVDLAAVADLDAPTLARRWTGRLAKRLEIDWSQQPVNPDLPDIQTRIDDKFAHPRWNARR